LGEIDFIVLRYGVHKIFWSLPTVTLTFGLINVTGSGTFLT